MSNHKSIALLAALCGFASLPTVSAAQPFWSQYGKDAQHSGMSTSGVQNVNAVLWQTPVDLFPVGSTNGGVVLAHYGSTLVTQAGTVVVDVRTGPNNTYPSVNDTYRVEGHDLGTGVTTWTENSDFVDWMPHDWTPIYGAAIDPANHLYYAGPGGTIYKRSSADAVNATVTQLCFYGMSNFQSTSVAYASNIQVCTPITTDANNNIYFGFYVASEFTSPLGISSGIAKISSTGVGTWVSADGASGFTGQEVATNCAPAVTADGKFVYVGVKQQGNGNYSNPVLLRLNTINLATASQAFLSSPSDTAGDTSFPYLFDDGSASPTIGPDGDVYYGVWYSNIDRGFMLHYSADLSLVKTPGAFGWDDTPSIVPASAVPSYSGKSSYLILTKYNNYSDSGITPKPGNGLNEVAVLDPNATEDFTTQYDDGTTGPIYQTMKEVLTVVGPTANVGIPGVREWCINMAAIDIAGKSAVVNCEDGNCYRWDFASNTLSQGVDLQPATSEAYTSTAVSADGISFAINNAVLFAIWDGAQPSSFSMGSTVAGGSTEQATLNLSASASGPGATIQLASNNPNLTVPSSLHVPAGQNSISFTVSTKVLDSNQSATITATRYGLSASTTITVSGSGLYSFVANSPVLYGGQTGSGNVALAGPAPTAGRTVTLTSSIPSVTFSPSKVVIAQGGDYSTYKYTTSAVATTQTAVLTATLDDGSKITKSIVNHAALVTPSLSIANVVGGTSDRLNLATQDAIPSSGINIAVTYSAHTSGPATINVKTDGTPSSPITTVKVANSVNETISVAYDGNTTNLPITISPGNTLKTFTLNANTVYETNSLTGTVTTAAAASGNTAVLASSSNSELTVTQPTGATGKTSATFTVTAGLLSASASQTDTISVQFSTTMLTQSVTVTPLTVTSLSVSSATITEGQTTMLTIHMAGPVSSPKFWCALATGSKLLTGAGGVYFNPGYTYATVPLKAAATVGAKTVVPVTVTLRGVTTTIDVTVEP
ncbi:MAG TPA: hypothetical protein VGL56_12215 [Fimbriimonadaceae bacterium]|jgi:hypothetical protein